MKTLKKLKQRIKEHDFDDKGLKKVILFGSYVKDQYKFGSDVDLLWIKENDSSLSFEEVYELLTDLSLEFSWSPLIMTEKKLHHKITSEEYWIIDALNEGKVIWPQNE